MPGLRRRMRRRWQAAAKHSSIDSFLIFRPLAEIPRVSPKVSRVDPCPSAFLLGITLFLYVFPVCLITGQTWSCVQYLCWRTQSNNNISHSMFSWTGLSCWSWISCSICDVLFCRGERFRCGSLSAHRGWAKRVSRLITQSGCLSCPHIKLSYLNIWKDNEDFSCLAVKRIWY